MTGLCRIQDQDHLSSMTVFSFWSRNTVLIKVKIAFVCTCVNDWSRRNVELTVSLQKLSISGLQTSLFRSKIEKLFYKMSRMIAQTYIMPLKDIKDMVQNL